MKKILLSLLVILLLLTACGDKEAEEVILEDDVEEEVITEPVETVLEVPDPELEPVPEPEPKPEPEPVETETFAPADLLITGDVGDYEYEGSKKVTKELNGYDFDSYEATYSLRETEAIASVLILQEEGASAYGFLNKTGEAGEYILLDADDYSYLEADIYYNPYENLYLWMSDDKIITVQYSIGTEMLEEYLEDYPTTIVSGSYDDQISLELIQYEEKIIFFENKQFVFELENIDENEIELSINNEEETYELNEKVLYEDLYFEVDAIEEVATLVIKKLVTEYEHVNIGVNSPVDIELDGEDITLEITGVNSDLLSVILFFNGDRTTLDYRDAETVDGFNVKLNNLFINTIGEETVDAVIQVWK